MTAEIYYFSGTGNSLAVARDIARKINAKLIPVVSIIGRESIDTDADVIGFVFPIYDFNPPLIIEKFVRKLKNINSKYIFAVCTYGITPSKSLKYFETVIKSCGGNLSAGFAVRMPHTGIGSSSFSQIEHERMFKNWKIKLEAVSEYIIAKKKGKVETSNLFGSIIASGLFIKMLPALLKLLKQVITKGWKSLTLDSNENCNGCGICKKICPVDNIEMVGNKPRWSSHCALCFACLHWCPKEAINAGSITEGMPRYHHSDVKLSDMINQKTSKGGFDLLPFGHSIPHQNPLEGFDGHTKWGLSKPSKVEQYGFGMPCGVLSLPVHLDEVFAAFRYSSGNPRPRPASSRQAVVFQSILS